MGVSGIGAGGAAGGTAAAGQQDASTDIIAEFMSYMKESPEQRMEDMWLNAHGITRRQLDAMSPQERQKILDKMRQDIRLQVKQATEKKTGSLI